MGIFPFQAYRMDFKAKNNTATASTPWKQKREAVWATFLSEDVYVHLLSL